MLAKHPPALLLASLLLGLTLVACNGTVSTPPPALGLPTPTAGGTRPPTAPSPSLTPTALSRPTAPAGASVASPTLTEGAPFASPTVVAQAPGATPVPPAPTEQALAPEQNPPGDIPDTQAFISYSSDAGAYTLDVPEGWARSENSPNVSFVDKLDGLMVTITDTATAPTARTAQVTALQQTGRAVQVTDVKDVTLPGGPAVLLAYTSNSEPNAVTGKQVRLENNAYLFYRNGMLATVTVWAPLGADNVDQWQRIAQSFRWR